jgi:hypothetical protein
MKIIFNLRTQPKKHSFYSFFNRNGSQNGPLNFKVFLHGGHLLFLITKMINSLTQTIIFIFKINRIVLNGKSKISFLMICANAFLLQFLKDHNIAIFKDIKNNMLEKNAF